MIRAIVFAAAMFAVGAAGAMVVRHIDDNPRSVGTGPAPLFTLTAQDGKPVSLVDLRGKTVVLSFAFTTCGLVCPIAMGKFVDIQNKLGPAFGRDVRFVTVTIDPRHDTTEVLADYAHNIGAKTSGWSFLTGSEDAVQKVARRYGVYARPDGQGSVEHIQLTTLIDRDGVIRLQYLGERFDSSEMLSDIRAMVAKGRSG